MRCTIIYFKYKTLRMLVDYSKLNLVKNYLRASQFKVLHYATPFLKCRFLILVHFI